MNPYLSDLPAYSCISTDNMQAKYLDNKQDMSAICYLYPPEICHSFVFTLKDMASVSVLK